MASARDVSPGGGSKSPHQSKNRKLCIGSLCIAVPSSGHRKSQKKKKNVVTVAIKDNPKLIIFENKNLCDTI